MTTRLAPLLCIAALSSPAFAQDTAAVAPSDAGADKLPASPFAAPAAETTPAKTAETRETDVSPFSAPTPTVEARRQAETRRIADSLDDDDSLYGSFIAERLSIGVSFSATSMKKTHVPYDPSKEGNFLGNINNLDESDMNGVGVIVRYKLCPYLAVQFSNDTSIELGMWNNENVSRDANFVAKGRTYEALLMYPIDAIRCTPYAGLGTTDLSCSIDYNNWWHWGWSSPADYDAYAHGSTEPRNGTSRWMIVDGPSSALTYSAGVSVKLWRYAELDVFYRWIDADDALIDFRRHEGRTSRHMRDGYVPLKCSSFGGALRVVF